jgi:hypothetical protein
MSYEDQNTQKLPKIDGLPCSEISQENLSGRFVFEGSIKADLAIENTHIGSENTGGKLELSVYDLPAITSREHMLKSAGINGELKGFLMAGFSGEDPIRYAIVQTGGQGSNDEHPIWLPHGDNDRRLVSSNRVRLIPMLEIKNDGEREPAYRAMISRHTKVLVQRGLRKNQAFRLGRESDEMISGEFPSSDLMSRNHGSVEFNPDNGILTIVDDESTNGLNVITAAQEARIANRTKIKVTEQIGHRALE